MSIVGTVVCGGIAGEGSIVTGELADAGAENGGSVAAIDFIVDASSTYMGTSIVDFNTRTRLLSQV